MAGKISATKQTKRRAFEKIDQQTGVQLHDVSHAP